MELCHHVWLQTKQRYDKSCEELDQARAQFEKADADPNITRAKIEKVY